MYRGSRQSSYDATGPGILVPSQVACCRPSIFSYRESAGFACWESSRLGIIIVMAQAW